MTKAPLRLRIAAVIVGLLAVTLPVLLSPVGERAPSPSPVVTATARADSEAAPARSLADGNGEDGGEQWVQDAGRSRSSGAPAAAQDAAPPASTVTQSALTGKGGTPMGSPPPPRWIPPPNVPTRPTVTVSPTDGGAYIAPDTPVATSRAVETLAPKSINSYDPWPAYLWPVVECLIARESRGNPYAVGSAGERGLMQVHPITWGYLARYGITPDALFDPATNIRAAYLLYIEAGGLRPWGGGCA